MTSTRRSPLAVLADSGPVVVLAGIAAAGSFTHIHDTARSHGQRGWMAWAVAVCIDLTCVMAARERQRDKRTGRSRPGLSWPTIVLAGGVLLSLAANLAQAQRSVWGWVVAATPAAAFLVAVSMLERRASATTAAAQSVDQGAAVRDTVGAPPAFGAVPDRPSRPTASSPAVPTPSLVPELVPGTPGPESPEEHGQTSIPVPARAAASAGGAKDGPLTAGPLLDFARRVSAEFQDKHGRPITRDALRTRLGVSNQLASDLLRQVRTESATTA